jgi:hypothetical protein
MQKPHALARFPEALFAVVLAVAPVACAPTPPREPPWSGPTLRLVAENKISKLVHLDHGHYEGSGVTLLGDQLYVVLDDTSQIARIDTALSSGTWVGGDTGETNYEGITVDPQSPPHFYVMKEMESAADMRGKVLELDGSARYEATQWTNMTFTAKNKGFEGVAFLRTGADAWLLGLCEGNGCTGDEVNVGHGRIQVMRLQSGTWTVDSSLDVPASANFEDYSDIALLPGEGGTYKVAITSQRSSKLWIGTLSTSPWSFTGTAAVYDFPKDEQGETQYCTVEGVTFLSATRVAIASDMDDSGSSACNSKDESVHLFDIP